MAPTIHHVPADVAELLSALEEAEPGQELGRDVRQSAFEVLAETSDARGLSFTATSSDPDPLGIVAVTKDPNMSHERASKQLMQRLLRSLVQLGYDEEFLASGSTRYSFGLTKNKVPRKKEPDDSIHYKAHCSSKDPPVMVVESALSQSTDSLLADLRLWVQPRPAGGGAQVAVGIDIDEQPYPGPLKLTVYVYVASRAQGRLIRQLEFGDGTSLMHPGDPAYFVWLPLSLLMPGSWWVKRLWLAARIAVGGLQEGCKGFLSWKWWAAAHKAWQRLWAPWAALPVDMYYVRFSIEATRQG